MIHKSTTETISQTLDAANGHIDVTKTGLVYNVFLSPSQLKEYLNLLTENELLRYEFITRTFKTTQKGLKFLYLYNKIDELMMIEKEKGGKLVSGQLR